MMLGGRAVGWGALLVGRGRGGLGTWCGLRVRMRIGGVAAWALVDSSRVLQSWSLVVNRLESKRHGAQELFVVSRRLFAGGGTAEEACGDTRRTRLSKLTLDAPCTDISGGHTRL